LKSAEYLVGCSLHPGIFDAAYFTVIARVNFEDTTAEKRKKISGLT
jgi:hypothetical protein